MDDRKRSFDAYGDYAEPKRVRTAPVDYLAEDIITRLLVTPAEFGKIIGKGGTMIASIKAKCAVQLRAVEINESERVVILIGRMQHVLDAFDIISELLCTMHPHNITSPTFLLQLLIEHNKAGKIIGNKGSNVMMLKSKSGCPVIRFIKEPQDYNGELLRILSIEGTLTCIRRAHFHILELLQETHEPVAPVFVPPPMPALPGAPIPMAQLPAVGIHSDVVRQLREMQSYLNQFGVDMFFTDTRTAPPPQHHHLPPSPEHHSRYERPHHYSAPVGYGAAARLPPYEHDVSDKQHFRNAKSVQFLIPKEKAGGLIGKGGVNLKTLSAECNCSIRLDREEEDNMRRVHLYNADMAILQEAKEKVLEFIENLHPDDELA